MSKCLKGVRLEYWRQFFKSEAMNTEKFEGHDEGWRTLWLTIAGVMAITLTWNILMLSLNGISYFSTNKPATAKKKTTSLVAQVWRHENIPRPPSSETRLIISTTQSQSGH
jgi:hypothetical protein